MTETGDSTGRIRGGVRRHPVLAFFILTFAISWGGIFALCWPSGIPGSGAVLDRLIVPVFVAMLAGPFLSAIVLTLALDGRSGLVSLVRGFTIWRAGLTETLFATCLIPASALAVLLPLSLISPAFTPGFLDDGGGVALIALSLAGGLFVALIEETGWTGFVTPRLLSARNVIAAAIVLGIVHGVWHFLSNVWVEGDRFGLVFLPYFLTAWVLALVNMRILAVWLYDRTGSTLAGAVVHASHTGGLLAIWPTTTTPIQDLVWTAAFGVVGFIAVLWVTRRSGHAPRSE